MTLLKYKGSQSRDNCCVSIFFLLPNYCLACITHTHRMMLRSKLDNFKMWVKMAKWHESECSFGNNNNHNGISVSSNYFTFRFSELFFLSSVRRTYGILLLQQRIIQLLWRALSNNSNLIII